MEFRTEWRTGPSSLTRRPLLVEVLGRYSNLCDQAERIRTLVEIVPSGPLHPETRTPKQVHHRLEPAEIQGLKHAYASGATVDELACEFHVHRTTVMDILERAGIARRGKGPSSAEISVAIQLYQEGKSAATIGQMLGFSHNTIRQRLLDAGVAIRGPHDWQRS
jgi:hypothetical protein